MTVRVSPVFCACHISFGCAAVKSIWTCWNLRCGTMDTRSLKSFGKKARRLAARAAGEYEDKWWRTRERRGARWQSRKAATPLWHEAWLQAESEYFLKGRVLVEGVQHILFRRILLNMRSAFPGFAACQSGVAAPLCHRTPRRCRVLSGRFLICENLRNLRIIIKKGTQMRALVFSVPSEE